MGLINWPRPAGRRNTRILRRGTTGADVAWLRRELRRCGYDPGDEDGKFGFLTEDAVRQLQMDYRLRPDGVVGPEVYGVLNAVRPVPVRRITHKLRGRADLDTIAERLGVSPDYVARVNRLRRGKGLLEPGQRIDIFPRWLLLEIDSDGAAMVNERLLERYGSRLTGIVDRRPPAELSAPPRLGWPPGAWGWVRFPRDLTPLSSALPPMGGRRGSGGAEYRETSAWIARIEPGEGKLRGVHVHRGRVPWGRGLAWARGAAALSTFLWRRGLTLIVTLSLPDPRRLSQRLFGDLHLSQWVPLTEAVIIPGPALGGKETFAQWHSRLEAARAYLAPWKCVVGLDVRAVERDDKGHFLRRLSHQQALALCYRHRVRPSWDEGAACNRAVYEDDGGVRHLYLWTRATLAAWLERILLWGYAGACLKGVGAGEERWLDEAFARMAVARHVEPVPGIQFPQGEGGA